MQGDTLAHRRRHGHPIIRPHASHVPLVLGAWGGEGEGRREAEWGRGREKRGWPHGWTGAGIGVWILTPVPWLVGPNLGQLRFMSVILLVQPNRTSRGIPWGKGKLSPGCELQGPPSLHWMQGTAAGRPAPMQVRADQCKDFLPQTVPLLTVNDCGL